MSRFFEVPSKSAVVLGVSTIVGAALAYNSYKVLKKILDDRPPKKWKKVGELSELWCFPIKSCGPVDINRIDCGILGAENGHLRDRIFVVCRSNGDFITARTYPKMVLIKPKIEGKILTVNAPDMDQLVIDISKLYSLDKKLTIKIWEDNAECVDCGDEAGRWFSKYILGEAEGLRLLFYPSSQPKPEIVDKKYLFPQADQKDTGALHDETSYMLMNQGSFDDLNTKIDHKVTALQYRPNFVVKGPGPWEEDNWKWVKIGDKTVFKVNQPCLRCVLTTIDPETGIRHPQMEPLKTLKTYRMFKNISPKSPFFGIHLGVREMGQVKIGDEIFIG